jgi:hypothetical protein
VVFSVVSNNQTEIKMNTKSNLILSTSRSQLAVRENELRNEFAKMTSAQIREMMNTTDNTTTKLICWEYLQTL